MSEDTTAIKLIGAKTYICAPAGITNPAKAGDIVTVSAEHATLLLQDTYSVGRHSWPVWTADLDAEVVLAGEPAMSFEQRAERDRVNAEAAEELARVTAEKEAGLAREAELNARIERLEAMFQERDGEKKEVTKRKRKVTAA